MKTAELQHRALPNQSAALQKGGAAVASPQGRRITQLETLIDASPAMLTQRRLINTIANSTFSRAKSEEPLQAKMINSDLPELTNGVALGGIYDLKVAGGGKGEKLKYPYLEYDYANAGGEVATKHEAMSEMQTAMADIGDTATH
ncbi:MAG: hypothetical protein FD130_1328, partial [Halothiobacillaceae bacterium]